MKKIILILSAFLMCSSLFAQVSLDPNDRFYTDAKNWETKGIISWLPQMRPYPVKTIKTILETVKEKGNDDDAALAEYYYRKIFGRSWNIGFTLGDKSRFSDSEDNLNLFFAEPEFYGNLEFLDLVTLSYKLGLFIQNKSVEEDSVCSMFHYRLTDTHDDSAKLGPLKANLDMVSNVTVGTDKLYCTLGLNRIAFGPVLSDSVMINGKQFHSGNFIFNYDAGKWDYVQSLSVLSRSTKNEKSAPADFAPEKYLAFHSVRFKPADWISISYYDASIYTNRFDPAYFIPVPYMVTQCMYSATDNLISGIIFDFRPFNGLNVSLATAFDDIDLNGLGEGKFDSRLKMTLMVGANYTPDVKFIDNIGFDYTLITPYTYSHSDPHIETFGSEVAPIADNYNKDNFTTRLQSLGTSIPPNSDRFAFAINFRPAERLRLGFTSSFVRHANIAESFSDEEAYAYIYSNSKVQDGYEFSNDGSVWTSPMYPDESIYTGFTPTASKNLFLKQDHKMYILQCGLTADFELERHKWGVISFSAGYMFEYIYNKGVDSNIYVKDSSVAAGSGSPVVDDDARALVASQKQRWIDNFSNQFNNYFMIAVKYSY
ncbi:MAG: hypothetical protein IK002_04650 [Treponema sp.]|uniref:hypothetical protein n=1 Tax=Treponema sp. TaxID=166 RepID=UPI00298D85DD|nr:hypothetical protein [Treponema sp.]MBR5933258.1 hypothetical protein [Treponema sp.]